MCKCDILILKELVVLMGRVYYFYCDVVIFIYWVCYMVDVVNVFKLFFINIKRKIYWKDLIIDFCYFYYFCIKKMERNGKEVIVMYVW